VSWSPLRPPSELADVDTARVWAASGAQWLTPGAETVPDRLVRSVVGLVDFLDDRRVTPTRPEPEAAFALLTERAALLGLGPSGSSSCGGATRLVPCLDGIVALSLPRPSDEALVPAWLEIDAPPHDVWNSVTRHVAARRAGQLIERAALLGLASSAVGETRPGSDAVLVSCLGAASIRPCEDALVVNLAPLWAGPLCARLLGAAGARVIDVESSRRPDGTRRQPAFHRRLHSGSESVALDLGRDEGRDRLRALLAAADVVIEGSRPRALRQMGIHACDLVRTGPRVWVSITGHGRTEPFAQRVAFGDDAAAAGGLIAGPAWSPEFLLDAVADPVTGLMAAASVIEVLGRGGRWLIDIALARVAASMVDPIPGPPVRPRSEAALPVAGTDAGTGSAHRLGADTTGVFEELGLPS
jgi:hypothetical protein